MCTIAAIEIPAPAVRGQRLLILGMRDLNLPRFDVNFHTHQGNQPLSYEYPHEKNAFAG